MTFPAGTRIRVPAGVASFPDPVFLPPLRSFAEKTYNIVHWSEIPSGGHFAALEQPDLMLADLRAFISTVAGEQH
jgi:pimeloyl-ACP methyl ester carboxylesterase